MTRLPRCCPACLSEDVDRILYGLMPWPPPEEAHVRLGGCCVIAGESPQYHCNECGNEWSAGESYDGRRRRVVDGAAPYGDLHTLEAWVGGFPGPSYRVVIDLMAGVSTWTGEGLDAGEQLGPLVRSLTSVEVAAFRNELGEVNPLRWKARYDRPGVMDGTSGQISITSGFRTSVRMGSNAYPRTWGRFCRLMEYTTGQVFR